MSSQYESQHKTEMCIAAAIQRGYNDMEQGRVCPWEEARQLADPIRESRRNETLRSRMAQQELPHAYGEEPLTMEEIEELREGYASAMRGELVDAREALARIREKYGL